MDDVAYRSPMRGVLRICQLNVIFYSRDPRFVSRSGVQPAGEPSRKRRDDRYESKETKLAVHGHVGRRT